MVGVKSGVVERRDGCEAAMCCKDVMARVRVIHETSQPVMGYAYTQFE